MKRVALQAQAAAMIAMAAPVAALAAPALVAFRRSMASTVLAARGRRSAEAEARTKAAPQSEDAAHDTVQTTTYEATGQSGRGSKVTLPAFPGDQKTP